MEMKGNEKKAWGTAYTTDKNPLTAACIPGARAEKTWS